MSSKPDSVAPAPELVRVYKSPEPITSILGCSVFLAGSIPREEDWRSKVISQLQHLPITIFNPLREDWDGTWVERKKDVRFQEQVSWELEAMEQADIIAMYLYPGYPSPISLLEFGLYARVQGKVVVCCPDGFEKKGNVEIVCERYEAGLVESLEELVSFIINKAMDQHPLAYA